MNKNDLRVKLFNFVDDLVSTRIRNTDKEQSRKVVEDILVNNVDKLSKNLLSIFRGIFADLNERDSNTLVSQVIQEVQEKYGLNDEKEILIRILNRIEAIENAIGRDTQNIGYAEAYLLNEVMNVLETARDSLSPKTEITKQYCIFETELNGILERLQKDNQSSLCETEFTYREIMLKELSRILLIDESSFIVKLNEARNLSNRNKMYSNILIALQLILNKEQSESIKLLTAIDNFISQLKI